MRLLALLIAVLTAPALAQAPPQKKVKTEAKKAVKKKQNSRAKPTPEQIRRFNELQKKQQQS